MILEFVRRLSCLSRARKRTILVAYDIASMGLALWAAFSTRLGEVYFPAEPTVILSASLSFLVGIVALDRLQVYRIVLRYFDLRTVSRIFLAAAVAAVAWVILV
jgi:FlaA1/EpsC-like NDP-sugar epimerase